MATLTKVGTPSLSSIVGTPDNTHYVGSGLKAGEAIAAGDLVYIASGGTVFRSIGTTLGAAAAKCRGIAAMAASSGEAVSVLVNVEVRYGSGLTPGANLFVSLTAGAIDDAATTGGTAPVGFVVDATRVRIVGSAY